MDVNVDKLSYEIGMVISTRVFVIALGRLSQRSYKKELL